MELKLLDCPICGAGGGLSRAADDSELWLCAHCKSRFTENSIDREQERIESVISSSMAGILDEALMRRNRECYYNLRSMLWEKINAKYIDSSAVVEICREIKKLDPHDFLAEFFEIANSGSKADIADYISGIDVQENALFLDVVISFLTFMLSEDLITPVAALLDRAGAIITPEEKQKLLTAFETEAKKVKMGIYEINMPRDVFVAYSSKDMPQVLKIINFIEANGLTCFAAFRNLQHGRDAVASYERALHTAIDNCSIFLFISSENSRCHACDALNAEIAYVRQRDMMKCPEARTYAQLPQKLRMLKIEYRLDNKPTPLADRTLRDFFSGLTYAENTDQLAERLGECLDELSTARIDNSERLDNEIRRAEEAERRAEEAERKLREMEDAETERRHTGSYAHDFVAEAAERIRTASNELRGKTAEAAKRIRDTMREFEGEQPKSEQDKESMHTETDSEMKADRDFTNESTEKSDAQNRAEEEKSFMDKFCDSYDYTLRNVSKNGRIALGVLLLFVCPLLLLIPLAVKLHKDLKEEK